MAAKNPYRPFVPDPEMMALRPEVTGNEINGLGETAVRRPRMVYWAPDPEDIAFGAVQRWFYGHEPPDPTLMAWRAERRAIARRPPPPRCAPNGSSSIARRRSATW